MALYLWEKIRRNPVSVVVTGGERRNHRRFLFVLSKLSGIEPPTDEFSALSYGVDRCTYGPPSLVETRQCSPSSLRFPYILGSTCAAEIDPKRRPTVDGLTVGTQANADIQIRLTGSFFRGIPSCISIYCHRLVASQDSRLLERIGIAFGWARVQDAPGIVSLDAKSAADRSDWTEARKEAGLNFLSFIGSTPIYREDRGVAGRHEVRVSKHRGAERPSPRAASQSWRIQQPLPGRSTCPS